MAITLEEIGVYLKAKEFNFQLDTEKEVIISGMSDGTEKGALLIRCKEDGEMFSLEMEPLNDDNSPWDIPKDHQYAHLILPQLLYANYNTKFGTWEYDPTDGDIKYTIEIPVQDGTITQKQFERILSGVDTAFEYQAKFKHIYNTGTMPPEEDASAELQKMLEQMLTQIKASKKDEGDGI